VRDAVAMWENTRMIVLVAVCAAIYGATLIVFKTAIPLLPGITEVRVANIFPMAFGFLFGPAGAWGLAIGNLIGDIFGGTLTPSSFAGFWGNFLLGYLPYTLWTSLAPVSPTSYDWHVKSWRNWTTYTLIALVSAAACGGFHRYGRRYPGHGTLRPSHENHHPEQYRGRDYRGGFFDVDL